MAKSMENIILGFVAVIVGVVLIGPLQEIVTDANITGVASTIVSLIPLFFGLGILYVTVKNMTAG